MFAVVTEKGPNWVPEREIREQPGWEEHGQFFDRLVEQGVVVLGGPISSDRDEVVALLAVEAASEQALRSTFDQDPWATSGILRLKAVRPWTIWLDGR